MDHEAQIEKFAANFDEAAVAGLLKTYRLVLSKPDAATVAFSDPAELARVRTNFVGKKLGVGDSDETIDATIKQIGEKMSDTRSKSRAAVYYLLAEHYGKLDLFK